MSEVFVCPTGTLDARSIRDLRKAGVVVVESSEPERCQFIRASELVGTNDLLWAAMSALNVSPDYSDKGGAQREAFTRRVFQIVTEAREQKKAQSQPPKETA